MSDDDEGLSLNKKLDKISSDQAHIMQELSDESVRRVKKKSWSLPFGVKAKAKRGIKRNKMLCVWLGANHNLQFKVVNVIGGLIQVGEYQYKAYEDGAIYHYKKLPVVVALENRLTLVGGMTDFKNAKDLNVGDFAQQTILRAIEKVEVDKEVGKKKKFNMIWLILLGIVAIYLISKAFTG